MNILLRQATILDPASPFHGTVADIAVRQGQIHRIAPQLPDEDFRVADVTGCFASPGFADPFAHFCDPGEEHRETLETGARAAAVGGYTDVLLLPNTKPVAHNKATVEYIRQRPGLPVQLHPIGAITKNTDGKELAELYDMHASGAVAFSDGLQPVQSGGLLLKALQYVLPVSATIIQVADDRSFNPAGLMHEGIVSTQLGLPGRPALAEEVMVARDIELVRYTGSKLHFTGISAAGSVARIRAAKQQGLAVTCSVSPLHLLFSEEDLRSYDTNLRLASPLRTLADRDALRTGVLDGTIDCIASHHIPHDTDHKVVEFEHAAPGAIMLQTAYAAVNTALGACPPDLLVAIFSTNVRRIFGLEEITLREGAPARITLHHPTQSWTFTGEANMSRSANSPLFGKALSGRIAGIIGPGGLFLNTF